MNIPECKNCVAYEVCSDINQRGDLACISVQTKLEQFGIETSSDCSVCNGTGVYPTPDVDCSWCGGTGSKYRETE